MRCAMAKIGLFGILSIFLSGTPVFADEQGEFLHTSYCYALTFQESDMFDIIGNSHGPTFTLPHGSTLNIQPFYNTYDEPYVLPGDFPDHLAAVRDDTDIGCTVDLLAGKYETTRITCPAKKEIRWVISFSERKDITTYGWLHDLNEEDRPRYEAIVNSLVLYTDAECEELRKAVSD